MKSFWLKKVGTFVTRQYVWLMLVFVIFAGWIIYHNLFLELDYKNLLSNTVSFKVGASKLEYQVTTYGPGPQVTRVVIDPQKVIVGQTQTLFLEANDSQSIKQVKAKTILDNNIVKDLELRLVSGTSKSGAWSTEWQVHDTHEKEYQTIFEITNNKGEVTKVSFNWLDPTCQPPDYVGNWAMSGTVTCVDSAIMGVTGDITVSSGTTLSLANTTLAYEPGKKITIQSGASIAISNGGGIQKGYLYARDDDNDGFFPAADPANFNLNNDISNVTIVNSESGGASYITSSDGAKYRRYVDLNNINWNIGSSQRSRTSLDCADADDSSAGWNGANAMNIYVHPQNNTVCSSSPWSCYHDKPFEISRGQLGNLGGFDYNCDGSIEKLSSNLDLYNNIGNRISSATTWNISCGYSGGPQCTLPNYTTGWISTVPSNNCGSVADYFLANSNRCQINSGINGNNCSGSRATQSFSMSCR